MKINFILQNYFSLYYNTTKHIVMLITFTNVINGSLQDKNF